MTQPPVVPQPAPGAKDNTQLFGILGIVFAFCCWPLGIVFAVLSQLQANKTGKPATLSIVAYVIVGLALVANIVYLAIAPFAGHDEALRQARLARDELAEVPA